MSKFNFEDLKDKTLISVVGLEKDSDEVIFETTEGDKYRMFHNQDCCESVLIEDVEGDVNDLIGFPILMAEEVISDEDEKSWYQVVQHTFYKLATTKGYVTIRWLGDSNGYYSMDVHFEKCNDK